MSNESHINCPNCNHLIDVNDIVYKKLQDQVKQEYQQKIDDFRKKLTEEAQKVEAAKSALAKEKAELQKSIEDGIAAQVKEERQKITTELRKKLADEHEEEMKNLQGDPQIDLADRDVLKLRHWAFSRLDANSRRHFNLP